MSRIAYFIILLFICSNNSAQNYKYNRTTNRGSECLAFYDSTYKYIWFRGTGNDTFIHSGKYLRKGDTLILTSFRQPNNYSLIKVKEKRKKNYDSLIVLIRNIDLPKSFPQATVILINGMEFNYRNDGLKPLIIRMVTVSSIIVGDNISHYPVYYSKNSKSNYFYIETKFPHNKQDIYPKNSYFFQEKFLIDRDSLCHLLNNKTVDYDIFKKVSKFTLFDNAF